MTEKYKILALFGQAGAGKNYVQEEIMKTDFGKKKLNKILSYTTRPKREREINGIDYFFVEPYEFQDKIDKKEFLEVSSFRGWHYGTWKNSLNINKINIGIFNIEGIKNLLKNNEVSIVPIYIFATDKVRLLRQLNREAIPLCSEICRRFETDRYDFLDIPFQYITLPNESEENFSVTDLIYIIEECERNNWTI